IARQVAFGVLRMLVVLADEGPVRVALPADADGVLDNRILRRGLRRVVEAPLHVDRPGPRGALDVEERQRAADADLAVGLEEVAVAVAAQRGGRGRCRGVLVAAEEHVAKTSDEAAVEADRTRLYRGSRPAEVDALQI